MAKFISLVIDVSPGRRREKLAPAPQLGPDVDRQGLTNYFRQCLAERPQRFQADVVLPGNRHIELEWHAAGHTAGVALWNNNDHTAAVSILLNGVEMDQDMKTLAHVLADRGFTLPKQVAAAVDDEARRPLVASCFYSHKALRSPTLMTLIPTFALTFFSQFGTVEM